MLFNRLKYPPRLVDSTICTFIDQQYKAANQEPESSKQKVVRIALPFKDQKSADLVKKQLANLSNVIGTKVQPVYTSRKIGKDLAVSEAKPPLVNKQNVVYNSTSLNVICATLVISDTRAAICTNGLTSTAIQR